MKNFMLIGGLFGFVMAALIAWKQGAAWPSILWRASLAACAVGWLLRWWAGCWLKGYYQAQADREAAREEAEAMETTTPNK